MGWVATEIGSLGRELSLLTRLGGGEKDLIVDGHGVSEEGGHGRAGRSQLARVSADGGARERSTAAIAGNERNARGLGRAVGSAQAGVAHKDLTKTTVDAGGGAILP